MRQSRGVHHLLVLLVSAVAVFALAAVIMWGLAALLKSVIPGGVGSRVLLSMASMILACFVAAWGFSAMARAVGFLGLMGGRPGTEYTDDLEMEELRQMLSQSIPTPEMIREHLQSLRASPQLQKIWRENYRGICAYAQEEHRDNWKAYEEACNSV